MIYTHVLNRPGLAVRSPLDATGPHGRGWKGENWQFPRGGSCGKATAVAAAAVRSFQTCPEILLVFPAVGYPPEAGPLRYFFPVVSSRKADLIAARTM
jgi:hypothetical protein